jgi:hypothetical protein
VIALDFGDAPDPLVATAGKYPTLLSSDGARHVILPLNGSTLRLGARVDPDADAQSDDTDPSDREDDSATAAWAQVTVHTLRKDSSLQNKVSYRLNELSNPPQQSKDSGPNKNEGKRSGRTKTITDIIVKDIEWPHYYIQRTCSEKHVVYDDLTLSELVAGTLTSILVSHTIPEEAELQIEHLVELMTDVEDFPFPVIRQFNGLVLQDIELGRYDWRDVDIIQKKKLRHVARADAIARRTVQRPTAQSNNSRDSNPNRDRSTPPTTNLPLCPQFNSGACRKNTPHNAMDGTAVRHYCAFCKQTIDRYFVHPQTTCRRKNENNESQTSQPSQPSKNASAGT